MIFNLKTSIIKSISIILLILYFPFLLQANEIKYKRYDRQEMGVFYKEAEKYKEEIKWEEVINRGKEIIKSQWEKCLWEEMARQIDEGRITNEEAEEIVNENKAEWEDEAQQDISIKKGEWQAEKVKHEIKDKIIKQEEIDAIRIWIEQAEKEAELLSNFQDGLDRWNLLQDQITTEKNKKQQVVNDLIEDQIKKAINKGILGDILVEKSFTDEIKSLAAEYEKRWEWEIDASWIRKRNVWLTRFIEEEDPEAQEVTRSEEITMNIIGDTKERVSKAMEGSLNQEAEKIDWDRQENFQKFQEVIEEGLKEWDKAIKELYIQWSDWKEKTDINLQTAQEAWEKGYKLIKQEQEQWQEEIEEKIRLGREEWENKREEIIHNRNQASDNLDIYNQTQLEAWQNYTEELGDLFINGANIVNQAEDNLVWLENIENYCYTLIRGGYVVDFYLRGRTHGVRELKDRPSHFLNMCNGILTYGTRMKFSECHPEDYHNSESYRESTLLNDATVIYWDGHYFFESSIIHCITAINTYDNHTYEGYENYMFHKFDYLKSISLNMKYYQSKTDQWENIRSEINTFMSDGEMNFHNELWQADSAVGLFHDNKDLNPSDMYYMTDTESELETLKAKKDFWAQRLSIAEYLKTYVEAPLSERASREQVEANLKNSLDELNNKKAECDLLYDTLYNTIIPQIETKKYELVEKSAEINTAQDNLDEAMEVYATAKIDIVQNGETEARKQTLSDAEDLITQRKNEYKNAKKSYDTINRAFQTVQKSYIDQLNKINDKTAEVEEKQVQYQKYLAVSEYQAGEYENNETREYVKADYNRINAILNDIETLYNAKKEEVNNLKSWKDMSTDTGLTVYIDNYRALLETSIHDDDFIDKMNQFSMISNEAVSLGYEPQEIIKMKANLLRGIQVSAASEGRDSIGYIEITKTLSALSSQAYEETLMKETKLQLHKWDLEMTAFEEEQNRWEELMQIALVKGNSQWQEMMDKYSSEWKKWITTTEKEMEKIETQFTLAAENMKKEKNQWVENIVEKGIEYDMAETKKIIVNTMNKNNVNTGASFLLQKNPEHIANKIINSMRPHSISDLLISAAKNMDVQFNIDTVRQLNFNTSSVNQFNAKMDYYSEEMDKMGKVRFLGEMNRQIERTINSMKKCMFEQEITSRKSLEAMYSEKGFNIGSSDYTRRIIIDSALIGGDKYKIQKITAYRFWGHYMFDYKKITPAESENMLMQEIKILSERTLEDINKSYKEKISKLTDHIGNMEQADNEGNITKAGSGEMNRLVKALMDAEVEKAEGEAKANQPWYKKGILPGVSFSITSIAKIGLSVIPGGQLAALAVSAAETLADISNGLMSWAQLGLNMVTSAVSVGVDWLGNQVSGLVQSAVSGASSAVKTIGNCVASIAKTAVTTAGNVLKQGFKTNGNGLFDLDWGMDKKTWKNAWNNAGKSFIASTAGEVASTLTTSIGIGSTGIGGYNVSSFARSMATEAVNYSHSGEFNFTFMNAGYLMNKINGNNTGFGDDFAGQWANNMLANDRDISRFKSLGLGLQLNTDGPTRFVTQTRGGVDLNGATFSGLSWAGEQMGNLFNSDSSSDDISQDNIVDIIHAHDLEQVDEAVKNNDKFLKGIENLQKKFGLSDDQMDTLLNKCENYYDQRIKEAGNGNVQSMNLLKHTKDKEGYLLWAVGYTVNYEGIPGGPGNGPEPTSTSYPNMSRSSSSSIESARANKMIKENSSPANYQFDLSTSKQVSRPQKSIPTAKNNNQGNQSQADNRWWDDCKNGLLNSFNTVYPENQNNRGNPEYNSVNNFNSTYDSSNDPQNYFIGQNLFDKQYWETEKTYDTGFISLTRKMKYKILVDSYYFNNTSPNRLKVSINHEDGEFISYLDFPMKKLRPNMSNPKVRQDIQKKVADYARKNNMSQENAYKSLYSDKAIITPIISKYLKEPKIDQPSWFKKLKIIFTPKMTIDKWIKNGMIGPRPKGTDTGNIGPRG